MTLDVLHREMLDDTLRGIGVDPAALDAPLLDELNRAWHRLDPWPDAVDGIARLKRRFPVVTLTNGNIALMLAMARRGGLPWDALLGAEVSGIYKPDPGAYLRTVEILGLRPEELCLVASAPCRSRRRACLRARHRLCREAAGVWRRARAGRPCRAGVGLGMRRDRRTRGHDGMLIARPALVRAMQR